LFELWVASTFAKPLMLSGPKSTAWLAVAGSNAAAASAEYNRPGLGALVVRGRRRKSSSFMGFAAMVEPEQMNWWKRESAFNTETRG
jgi:hypothetical protein